MQLPCHAVQYPQLHEEVKMIKTGVANHPLIGRCRHTIGDLEGHGPTITRIEGYLGCCIITKLPQAGLGHVVHQIWNIPSHIPKHCT